MMIGAATDARLLAHLVLACLSAWHARATEAAQVAECANAAEALERGRNAEARAMASGDEAVAKTIHEAYLERVHDAAEGLDKARAALAAAISRAEEMRANHFRMTATVQSLRIQLASVRREARAMQGVREMERLGISAEEEVS